MTTEMFPKEAPEALDTKIKGRWARLTDRDIEELHGNLNALPEKLEIIYGKPKEMAEREVADFKRSLTMKSNPSSSKSSPGSSSHQRTPGI